MDEDIDPFGGYLDEEGALERKMSALEDVPGAPTWPIAPTDTRPIVTPPVGLNWAAVARQFGIEERVLRHGGSIVLTGEYFPEAGFAIDPDTMRAHSVDAEVMALAPAYFVGKLMASEHHIRLPLEPLAERVWNPIVREVSGPIIGLFLDEDRAGVAKREILQGSLGSGVSLHAGPLGIELRVSRPELPGRVATVIASEGGAIILR